MSLICNLFVINLPSGKPEIPGTEFFY